MNGAKNNELDLELTPQKARVGSPNRSESYGEARRVGAPRRNPVLGDGREGRSSTLLVLAGHQGPVAKEINNLRWLQGVLLELARQVSVRMEIQRLHTLPPNRDRVAP